MFKQITIGFELKEAILLYINNYNETHKGTWTTTLPSKDVSYNHTNPPVTLHECAHTTKGVKPNSNVNKKDMNKENK